MPAWKEYRDKEGNYVPLHQYKKLEEKALEDFRASFTVEEMYAPTISGLTLSSNGFRTDAFKQTTQEE